MYPLWRAWLVQKLRRRVIGRALGMVDWYTRGHRFWAEFVSKEPEMVRDGRAIRLDLILPPGLGRMDHADAVPDLTRLAVEEFARWPDKQRTVAVIIANMFRLQLSAVPTFALGRVVVRGGVRCTWYPPVADVDDDRDHMEYEAWSRRMRSEQLQVYVLDQYVGTIRQDVDGHWQCTVMFEVASPTISFSVEVKGPDHRLYAIEGSPYTVDDLMCHMGHEVDFLPNEGDEIVDGGRYTSPETRRKRLSSSTTASRHIKMRSCFSA